jgi:hypothetical protein
MGGKGAAAKAALAVAKRATTKKSASGQDGSGSRQKIGEKSSDKEGGGQGPSHTKGSQEISVEKGSQGIR